MQIGILLPGFSSDDTDWAIPVQSELMRALAARGEFVRVVALRYPHRRDHYRAFGAEVYSLGYGQARGLRRFALWREALSLIERLHGEKPFDVLHAMWGDETGLIAAWAGRRLGVPSVVSLLGGEAVALHDIGYGGQRTILGRWIVGQALSADQVIMPSEYIARRVAEAGYTVPARRIIFGTLGTNTSIFTPASSPDPRRIIHVASLVPVKDQATLLRAVALLNRSSDSGRDLSRPYNVGVTLDIYGKGTEEARLKAMAAELGIAERVVFRGSVDYPALSAAYQGAGLFVLTSRHEANCIAALEAAACGLPVVSTAVGRMPECPDMAITVPVGDGEALAAAIRSLIDDPARYAAMRAAARERAVREFEIGTVAEELIEMYRNVSGRP